MDIFGWAGFWAPVILIFIGWFLSEASQYWRLHREERKPIARALAELLTIRYSVFCAPIIQKAFQERIEVSPVELERAQHFFSRLLPDMQRIRSRYNEAVDLVSEVDPVLGYQLRSKELIADFNKLVEQIFVIDESTRKYWPQLEPYFTEKMRSGLEETLLELSRRHSIFTWIRVRRLLNRPIISKEEVDEFIKDITTRTTTNTKVHGT